MENYTDQFVKKITTAYATIQTETVSTTDEHNYTHEQDETWISFNGFGSAINYEADLNISYALMYDEVVRDLKAIPKKMDRVIHLQKLRIKLEDLKVIVYTEEVDERKFFRHKKIQTANLSENEIYRDQYVSDYDLQGYLRVANHIIEKAIKYTEELIKTVQLDTAEITTPATPELISAEQKRLKINLSKAHISVLYRLLDEANLMDEGTKERVFEFIATSFETKQESKSTEYLRRRYDGPGINHLDDWQVIFQKLQTAIKKLGPIKK